MGAQVPLLLLLGTRTSWLFPAATLLLCGFAAATIIFRDPKELWSPMPWFLMVSSLFFGLGPMLHFFGNPETIAYVSSFYPVEPEKLNRVFLLNAVGLVVVMVVYSGVRPNIRAAKAIGNSSGSSSGYVWLFWFTFGFGFVVQLVVSLDLWEWDKVPGFVGQLANLTKFSLLPAAYLAVQRRGIWVLLCAGVSILVLNWELSSLMKSEVIEAFTMIFLGVYLARPRFAFFAVFGVVALASYLYVLSPLVGFGRQMAMEGERHTSSWELLQRYAEYKRNSRLDPIADAHQWWWSRLDYSNAQLFAMDQYDAGVPGNTYKKMIYAPIPRILWPGKPVMTSGGEFYSSITGGATGTSAGPGAWGEAYWNGGWGLVALSCAVMGAFFALFSVWNVQAVENRQAWFFPTAIMAILNGLTPDHYFTTNYLSRLPILVALTVFFYFIIRSASPSPNPRGGTVREPVANSLSNRPRRRSRAIARRRSRAGTQPTKTEA